MLLRSSSTPVQDSWIPQSKEPSVETHPESVVPPIPKRRSLSLTLSRCSSVSSSNDDDSVKKLSRALSVNDAREVYAVKKKTLSMDDLPSIPVEEEEDQDLGFHLSSRASSMKKLFVSESANGDVIKKKDVAEFSVAGGGGIGRSGGGGVGGERNSGSNDNHEKRSVEAYYQNMIQANPGNALFLVNYAKYLKEIKCDLEKAEEYCGRAILANPNDGHVLSLYADLIWQKNKDAPRAEVYFEQAVQAAPDDCYVMASYARFLWDAEDEEEGDEEEEEHKEIEVYDHGLNSHKNEALQLNFFNGTPLTAAS